MKTSRPRLSLILLATAGFVSLSAAPVLAHDPDEHHYYDHVRADQLSHHAAEDRYHAAAAMDRAYATGDPRDFLHALRDRYHAKNAAHDAHDAQDHAGSHGHYYRD